MGAEVVLVGRDRGRAGAAATEIGSVSTLPPKVEIADLASLEQVRSLAERLSTLERIDVLVNNAGLMLGERRVSPDGFEYVFAVNHLAPFLLTNLLLPKLTAATPPRGGTVTSHPHTPARPRLPGPHPEHDGASWPPHPSPPRPRRPEPGARVGQLALLRQQQAGEHPVPPGACPQARRHQGARQLRAPGRSPDQALPGGQAACAPGRVARPAVFRPA